MKEYLESMIEDNYKKVQEQKEFLLHLEENRDQIYEMFGEDTYNRIHSFCEESILIIQGVTAAAESFKEVYGLKTD